MKRILVLVLLMLTAGLIADFPPANAEEKKPEVACSVCTMKITEKNQKFSVIMPKVPGMETSAYDDVGCAVVQRNKECASRQSAFDSSAYTFDFETGAQVPVEKAFFVVEAGVWTPMGYEIIAFTDKARAEAFIAGNGTGKLLKWFEVVDLPIK